MPGVFLGVGVAGGSRGDVVSDSFLLLQSLNCFNTDWPLRFSFRRAYFILPCIYVEGQCIFIMSCELYRNMYVVFITR